MCKCVRVFASFLTFNHPLQTILIVMLVVVVVVIIIMVTTTMWGKGQS